MIILGLETSCDETSAAVLQSELVRSNIISSQHCHRKFGGVVPELASREHDRLIVDVVNQALQASNIHKNQLDFIAATAGPGLIGAVLVGLCFGQAFAMGLGIPFIPINHIEAHIFSSFIPDETHASPPIFPFISLTVSGGHTLIALVKEDLSITLIGKTLDDAAGEAFDKTGKMIGLPYPAGPEIDKLAQSGDPYFHQFPQALTRHSQTSKSYDGNFDFSFSGLKTSVHRYLSLQTTDFIRENLHHICASIQEAITSVLVKKTLQAASAYGINCISVSGGVSANSMLRKKFQEQTKTHGIQLCIPKPIYSTDNGAMIANLAKLKIDRGQFEPHTYTYHAFSSYL